MQEDTEEREEVPGFFEAFRWTDGDGEPDRALKWASLPLSLAFTAVYILSFLGLNRPLNYVTAQLPPLLSAVLCALVPAAAGTFLCTAAWRLLRGEGRVMAAAVRRMLSLAVLLTVVCGLLVWGEWDTVILLLRFFAVMVLPSVLLCGLAAGLLSRRDWLMEEEDEE